MYKVSIVEIYFLVPNNVLSNPRGTYYGLSLFVDQVYLHHFTSHLEKKYRMNGFLEVNREKS